MSLQCCVAALITVVLTRVLWAVLQTIEASANRYARHIVPIASCSIDFYVRVFVRVYKSPVNVKQAMTKLSYVFQVSLSSCMVSAFIRLICSVCAP